MTNQLLLHTLLLLNFSYEEVKKASEKQKQHKSGTLSAGGEY